MDAGAATDLVDDRGQTALHKAAGAVFVAPLFLVVRQRRRYLKVRLTHESLQCTCAGCNGLRSTGVAGLGVREPASTDCSGQGLSTTVADACSGRLLGSL